MVHGGVLGFEHFSLLGGVGQLEYVLVARAGSKMKVLVAIADELACRRLDSVQIKCEAGRLVGGEARDLRCENRHRNQDAVMVRADI